MSHDVTPFAHRYGTVGVVARDVRGDISAGTSTGGMQGKLPGRVGDSPVIGAGTYAANASCAVSATGVGEYFIRLDAAKEICALVEYKSMSIERCGRVRDPQGGRGDEGRRRRRDRAQSATSDPIWSYNTLGMFRARQVEGGAAEIEVK